MDTAHTARRIWFASIIALVAALASTPAAAVDQLKILVPANPGGGWDQTGRGLAIAMQESKIVKRIEIENVGGAAGTIGLKHFFNTSKGDPNALMVGGSVMVGGIALNKTPIKLAQITPIALLTGEYDILVIPGDSEIRSLKHLIRKFKENPESVIWGGGSAGGTDHLIVGLIAHDLGIDPARIKYVPFSGGGEAQEAMMKGEITVGLSGWNEFAGAIAAGKLRPIGITSEKRVMGLILPTLKENGVNVAMANWRAVFAPAGITEAQKEELVATLDKTVKSEVWRDMLVRNQWTNLYMAGDEFRDYLIAEQARIEKVINALGLVK